MNKFLALLIMTSTVNLFAMDDSGSARQGSSSPASRLGMGSIGAARGGDSTSVVNFGDIDVEAGEGGGFDAKANRVVGLRKWIGARHRTRGGDDMIAISLDRMAGAMEKSSDVGARGLELAQQIEAGNNTNCALFMKYGGFVLSVLGGACGIAALVVGS